jgi:hypothetical protein
MKNIYMDIRNNPVKRIYRPYDQVSLPKISFCGTYFYPLLVQTIAMSMSSKGIKVTFKDCEDNDPERIAFINAYKVPIDPSPEKKKKPVNTNEKAKEVSITLPAEMKVGEKPKEGPKEPKPKPESKRERARSDVIKEKPLEKKKQLPTASKEDVDTFFYRSNKRFEEILTEYYILPTMWKYATGKAAEAKRYRNQNSGAVVLNHEKKTVEKESKYSMKKLGKMDREAKIPGTVTVPTKEHERIAFVINSEDANCVLPPFSSDKFMLHATPIKYGNKIGVVTAEHGYNEAPEKFVIKSHKGGVLIEKSKARTVVCGMDLIFIECSVPGLKVYTQPGEIKEGQVRIIKHGVGVDCCTTSISQGVWNNKVYTGQLFEAEYNSIRGDCGAPVLDCEEHIYGVHIGTYQKKNLFSAIDWAVLDF